MMSQQVPTQKFSHHKVRVGPSLLKFSKLRKKKNPLLKIILHEMQNGFERKGLTLSFWSLLKKFFSSWSDVSHYFFWWGLWGLWWWQWHQNWQNLKWGLLLLLLVVVVVIVIRILTLDFSSLMNFCFDINYSIATIILINH